MLEDRHHRARGVRRHGESDPEMPAGPGRLDLGVDPHDVARVVQQGSAGVARVDGRIGLDRRVDLEPVWGLDVAPEARDDPLRGGAVEVERVAYGYDVVADGDRARVGELERAHTLGDIPGRDLQAGQ